MVRWYELKGCTNQRMVRWCDLKELIYSFGPITITFQDGGSGYQTNKRRTFLPSNRKEKTFSCFVFGVQYVCCLTGKAKPEENFLVSLEDVRKSGSDIWVSFRLPTQGSFFVHFKVRIGHIHTNSSFSLHAMSLPRVYNAFLGVAQRECPNS